MIFVTGAKASGKYDYVKSLGYNDEDISCGIIDESKVVYGLESIVADNPDCIEEVLPMLLKKEVVVCCEVGSGVIPVVGSERYTREQTGRLCIRIAREAERVVRLICGIPTVIKG